MNTLTYRDNISPDIYILTQRDLDARERAAFLRGVERGRFEASVDRGKERVAQNCANWKDGRCESCGVQWQGMEVSSDHRCAYFRARDT